MPILAWIVLYASFVIGLYENLLGIVTPHLQAQLALDYNQVGLIMSLMTLGALIGGLLGGDIAKRFEQRNLLIFYGSLMLFFLSLLVSTSLYVLLLIAFTGMGMLSAAFFTIGHTLLAHISHDEEYRSRYLSLADVGFSSGALLGPLWANLSYQWQVNWQTPYSLSMILVFLLLLAFLPKQIYQAAKSDSYIDDSTEAISMSDYLEVIRQPSIALALLACLCVGFVEWGQSFWLTSYVHKGLALDESAAHISVFILMLGMLSGRFWHAFIHSRWSSKQKLRALAILCVSSVLAQNLLGWTDWVVRLIPVFWLCSFCVGVGISVAFPILLGRMVEVRSKQAPRLSALASIATAIGANGAALSIGHLADWVGIKPAFALCAVPTFAYLLLVVYLLNTTIASKR